MNVDSYREMSPARRMNAHTIDEKADHESLGQEAAGERREGSVRTHSPFMFVGVEVKRGVAV
jgi:hypothetical protein